ncbi:ClbS/DfsB family four-helix bundle protein [Bifidobacterium sp. ESL0763]|uniref:ClbS/DfsB family four-helix bundle protein n=1 Tax=Bifidobacterium sp. ESL0763 TaxID=2983227 RepID=UPI0023F6E597|nr:ClbS/DfsB family four-helix bundle protein [Bifidobacterium sp. ESL0763]MDF7664497.1 ClbS/DfsB family four-helix bundle protein [Bifidobacterium sp. ESL0763]
MQTYQGKEDLKSTIRKAYGKYIAEFDEIPEALKDKRCEDVDRTPAENLAYQVGWTTLLLQWERDERAGRQVRTPSDRYAWNQLGDLYRWFTDTYAGLPLRELRERLEANVADILTMIDTMSEDEVFNTHQRRWADEATKTAVWPVWKFIHINTVAPFKTFRTTIRKWKKDVL